MKKLLIASALAAGFVAAPAFAQLTTIPSWYVGLGIGRGNLDMTGQDLSGIPNASINDNDTTYTVRLGYRFNPYFAVEGGYYDLGEYGFSGEGGVLHGTARAKSMGISAVGILPLAEVFELYGRLGIERSEVKVNANTATLTANQNHRETGATYGAGARYLFSRNFGIFAEWMKNDKIEVDSYLAGIDWRF